MRPGKAYLAGVPRQAGLVTRAQVVAAFGASLLALFDLSDLSTLYQDSGATTPVTADGQPIGYIGDMSGNGYHMKQSTSTARPTSQGTATHPYAAHDGVDDVVITTATLTFSLPFWMMVAIGRSGSAASELYFSVGASTTNMMGLSGTTGNNGRQQLRNTAHGLVTATASGLSVGNHVLQGLSVAGTTTSRADNQSTGSIANAWTTDTIASSKMATGGGNGGASSTAWNFFGGIVSASNPSAPNVALAKRWLGQLCGLSL